MVTLAAGSLFFLRKDVNYLYYRLFVQKERMESAYIVQYVGFKTALDEKDFIARWTPFAASFKAAGINRIDLYQVDQGNQLNFISRNIWPASTYFRNFPSGVAGAGSGGGIAVRQLGGYWIVENELRNPQRMQLIFANHNLATNLTSRNRCTEQVPFKYQLEGGNALPDSLSDELEQFHCVYLKTM